MNKQQLKEKLATECTTIDRNGAVVIDKTPAEMIDWIFNIIQEAIADKDTEKIYEIDFAGFLKAKISLKGNVPTIEAAMNGWGNPIDPKDVTIDELPAPYQETKPAGFPDTTSKPLSDAYQPKEDKP